MVPNLTLCVSINLRGEQLSNTHLLKQATEGRRVDQPTRPTNPATLRPLARFSAVGAQCAPLQLRSFRSLTRLSSHTIIPPAMALPNAPLHRISSRMIVPPVKARPDAHFSSIEELEAYILIHQEPHLLEVLEGHTGYKWGTHNISFDTMIAIWYGGTRGF